MRAFTRDNRGTWGAAFGLAAPALAEHNVGGNWGLPFSGYPMSGHNAGEVSASGNLTAGADQIPAPPPGLDFQTWIAMIRRFGLAGCMRLCNLSGGTPGLGFGGFCPAPSPPQIPVGADGCSKGWLQCKQPIAVVALAVGAGASVAVTVTPRRVMRANQFSYSGPALTFDITSMQIDGTEYLGSSTGIPADRYAAQVTDHSIDLAEFSSTTPLIVTVRNNTGAAADFRATLDGAAARS